MESVDKAFVKKLVASGEGEFIEFKRKVEDPEKIVKEILAFANSKGGWLLIGVSDNGNLPGLTHPEGDWFVLEKAVAQFANPGVEMEHTIVAMTSTRFVIVIRIHPSTRKPHYFQRAKFDTKEFYVRYRDECIRASKEWAEVISFEKRRIFIKYGEEERLLLEYLADHEEITLRGFKDLMKMPHRRASRILVKLTAANVLQLKPGYGKEDKFVLK